jgi:gas vesicle protein
MSSGKIVLGILAGIAAGALLGILFAPDKGSETRRKIVEKGKDLKDSVKEKYNEFAQSIDEKFAKVKEDIADITGHANAKSNGNEKVAV